MTAADEKFMSKALELAARGKGRTSPNPVVGAVLVKGGRIIASDYHRKAGSAHAEVLALKKAGPKARGATLYVTLEPCCHTDKRTPPCTRAIIAAGLRRVIVAVKDPNPKVAGRGIGQLRRAGIETVVNVLKEEALRLNESFVKYITTGTPFVVLKMAQSLDGKIATSSGESKWITGARSRRLVHELRNESDALLVGIGTVLKDNPSLDCRIRGGRDPFRVIVDSSLKIPLSAKVLTPNDGKTIIATTEQASQSRIARLEKTGASVMVLEQNQGYVHLPGLMKKLAERGIINILVEGGSSLAASALSERIVDKILFFVAPVIIGGEDAIPSVGGRSPVHLKHSITLDRLDVRNVGKDILVQGYPQYP